jgi:hypothetical protein
MCNGTGRKFLLPGTNPQVFVANFAAGGHIFAEREFVLL